MTDAAFTVADALAHGTKMLHDAEIDTPRLDAQLLLAWVLKARREDLAREPGRVLLERERVIWEKALSLRAARRPLAYITGEAWFYGRAFTMNRSALVPRPETEGLVDSVLKVCASRVAPVLADIGTGSGCIAVTLALERPGARVWATDWSANALTLARKNAHRHGVEGRVSFAQGDLLDGLPAGVVCDVIVSNPPYVALSERASLQPEVRDYEPPLALFGELNGTEAAAGPDGTALHRRLLQELAASLTPGGWLVMELGAGQAARVSAFAALLGWENIAVLPDLAGIDRVFWARRARRACG